MKIAACVILYNPEPSVENNIKSYINRIEKIYLFDNSEVSVFNIKFLSSYLSGSAFIHDGNNEGIAKRLNQACELAIKDGYDYLLTMDQDSYFEETSITNYLRCIEHFQNKIQVSMFGINHQKKSAETNCVCNEVKQLITSGSVINLNAYKSVGHFDESLFIDFVDTEYCLRSIAKGYWIIEFPNIFMQHSLGELSEQRSFKNLKKTSRSFHSPVRLYYMARNFLYVNSLYRNHFQPELSLHKKDVLNRIKNNLLYKQNRLGTTKFLIKAWKDFKKNKMGKLSD